MTGKPRAKVLATYNIKGGVGKTSTAVNLAYVAAEQGASVLLCDLDPQAASTYLFRVRPKVKGGGRGLLRLRRAAAEAIKATDHERLDLLPADFSYRHLDLALGDFKKPAARLKKVLAPLRREYDYIILDCAPSISLVSESVFAAANALLVPVVPARLSARVYEQLSELAQHGRVGGGKLQIFAFFSMVSTAKPLHLDTMVRVREHAGIEILGVGIPEADEIELMGERRNPVGAYAPESQAAVSYRALWSEILGRLDEHSGTSR